MPVVCLFVYFFLFGFLFFSFSFARLFVVIGKKRLFTCHMRDKDDISLFEQEKLMKYLHQ